VARSEQEGDIREAGYLTPAEAKLQPGAPNDSAEPEPEQRFVPGSGARVITMAPAWPSPT